MIDWVWVNANVRAFVWTGKPVNQYYWGIVIPYRRVHSWRSSRYIARKA
mgnify:CR=1 FL=1